MKRIKLFSQDFKVAIDNEPMFLSAAQWFAIKLDEHIDVVHYDSALGQGEIEWCPHAYSGRKPANDKFSAPAFDPHFDKGCLDRAVAMHAQRKAELKAEHDAAVQRQIEEMKAEAAKVTVSGGQ